MNKPPSAPRELLRLIHSACNGTLSDEDTRRLEAGLKENQQARELFIRLTRLEARLWLHHQIEEAFRPVEEQRGELPPFGRGGGVLRASVWRYAAVVALSIGATLLWSSRQPGLLRLAPGAPTHEDDGVASVRATHDIAWQLSEVPSTPPSRRLDIGEMVRLQEGLLQLDFHYGGSCLLQGPAVFEIASATCGKLYDGRLVTSVSYQKPQVMLETRNARVRAQSARIAMEADQSGKATIIVLEGDVKVHVGNVGSESATIDLSKGDSLQLQEDGRFRTASIPENLDFVERLPRALPAPAFAGDVIWLGNLFDDSTTASLTEAMQTDTYQAAAETIDLGVATVIDGGLDVDVLLAARGVRFDFSNYGGGGAAASGLPSNDTYRSVSPFPIRTTGVQYKEAEWEGKKIEEGIGMHANELLTFDLNEIRAAGRLGAQPMRFVVDRAGINDDIDFLEKGLPSTVRLFAIVSNRSEVIAGYINGKRIEVTKNAGAYYFKQFQREDLQEITGERTVSFDLPIPPDATYLTLAAVAGEVSAGDHAVFSGARLELEAPGSEPLTIAEAKTPMMRPLIANTRVR